MLYSKTAQILPICPPKLDMERVLYFHVTVHEKESVDVKRHPRAFNTRQHRWLESNFSRPERPSNLHCDPGRILVGGYGLPIRFECQSSSFWTTCRIQQYMQRKRWCGTNNMAVPRRWFWKAQTRHRQARSKDCEGHLATTHIE